MILPKTRIPEDENGYGCIHDSTSNGKVHRITGRTKELRGTGKSCAHFGRPTFPIPLCLALGLRNHWVDGGEVYRRWLGPK